MSPALALVWVGVAVAGEPGGFRLGPAGVVDAYGVRQVVAPVGDDAWVMQSVPRVRVRLGERAVLDAELPAVVAGLPGSWDVGLGQLRAGAFMQLAPQTLDLLIGVEGSVPVGPPGLYDTSAWGTLARETLWGFETMGVLEMRARNASNLILRLGAGVGTDRWSLEEDGFTSAVTRAPRLEASVAASPTLWGPLALVVEGELVNDRSPVGARAGLRVSLPRGVSVDLGAQVPGVALLDPGRGVVQGIGQVRWFPHGGPVSPAPPAVQPPPMVPLEPLLPPEPPPREPPPDEVAGPDDAEP